jgi:hypothetical protein
MIVYCCNNIPLNKLESMELLIAAFQYFDKVEYGYRGCNFLPLPSMCIICCVYFLLLLQLQIVK